jgi:hypothetical protein
MRTTRLFLSSLSLTLCLFACTQPASESQTETSPATETSPVADAEGYVPLFDGKTTKGWRNFKETGIGEQWVVEDGVLSLTGKGGGDIVTEQQYDNFDLKLEWKISPNGNSGLFFYVVEADSLEKVYHSGPEIQILDNDGHPDGKIHTHRSGDNYDLQASTVETVRPVGEWNELRLIVDNGHVEQWLNGTKVVEYELGSDAWEALYQKSKFTKWPMYGRATKGHIALQDHGNPVWFRNIKIKEL